MLETVANGLVLVVGLYVAIGLLFALYFVWRGVDGVDPSAEGGTWGFRLLILPGTVALWPLLVRRLGSGAPAEERNAHRELARSEGATAGRDAGRFRTGAAATRADEDDGGTA